ncbi:MAG: hypothetical protein ABMA13_19020, partial [Chthoniobacteraceae bacterium]
VGKLIDEAAMHDFKWWFAAVSILLICSGTIVFKWLIAQLALQRVAHAEVTKELIGYLKDDHAKSSATLERASTTLDKVVTTLERIQKHERSP